MNSFWQILAAIWTTGFFVFVLLNKQRLVAYFNARIEDKNSRNNLKIINNALVEERNKLEILREQFELEKQKLNAPFEAVNDAHSKKLELDLEAHKKLLKTKLLEWRC